MQPLKPKIISDDVEIQFFKGEFNLIATKHFNTDDIFKIPLPEDTNMVILTKKNGNSKSYFIGEKISREKAELIYGENSQELKKFKRTGAKTLFHLYKGPLVEFSDRTNLLPSSILFTKSGNNKNQIRHFALTASYPNIERNIPRFVYSYTEGYIKHYELQSHNLEEVQITSSKENYIELFDLSPDNEQINIETFAIGTPLSLSQVMLADKALYDFMKSHNLSNAFKDKTGTIHPIIDKNTKILSPALFNAEGFYDPESKAYDDLE